MWITSVFQKSYYNLSLLSVCLVVWLFVRDLLPGFSTNLNQIGHGQSVGVRERRDDLEILKFKTVAMKIWKCTLWGLIWPRSTWIFLPDPPNISIKWIHNFFDYLGILDFWPVSIETVKNGFWCVATWKKMWAKSKQSSIRELTLCLTK